MKKRFDYSLILIGMIIAFAMFVSSCATEAQRPYNSVVLGIHTVDTMFNANTFDRVEYYNNFSVSPIDSFEQVTSRVFVYDNGIELFIIYKNKEDSFHAIIYGDWLDQYIFKSHDGREIITFNEEYLDYVSDGCHFELIK